MDVASFFRSRGMTAVSGRTYPNTYAIATFRNFQGEQLTNRDSASWKKAEHIIVEENQPDQGRSLLPKWRMLTAAEPIGLSIQKLYVAVGNGLYAKYDAKGHGPVIDTPPNLVADELR